MNVLMKTALPDPPPDTFGWPWTVQEFDGAVLAPNQAVHIFGEERQVLPEHFRRRTSSSSRKVLAQRRAVPKISVIIVSLNQGHYLEAAIRSVLLQDYPCLECLVVDGGSSDQSIEVIRKYEAFLTRWVSEPDQGQTHAINKGLASATGHILSWLNSDDMLKPGTLAHVQKMFNGTNDPAWLVGAGEVIDEREGGRLTKIKTPPREISRRHVLDWPHNWFCQPSTFWNRAMLERVGLLDERYQYAMDFKWWVSMLEQVRPLTTSKTLSIYRMHSQSKSVLHREKQDREWILAVKKVSMPEETLRVWLLILRFRIGRLVSGLRKVFDRTRLYF